MSSIDVDAAAKAFGRWGTEAKKLPRNLFLRGAETHPLVTSRGTRLGSMVPGFGLALASDYKALGITKSIPGVIERTPFMRVLEKLVDDRGAITTMADLRSAPLRQTYTKRDTFTVLGSADLFAYCNFDTQLTTAHFSSQATNAPTRTSFSECYNFNCLDPTGGRTKYLIGVSSMAAPIANTRGFAMGVYSDMCSMWGNVALDVTTTTTINSAALTRYTNAVGVLPYLGVTPDGPSGSTFATAPTFSLNYTNSSGTARAHTYASTSGFVNSSQALIYDAGGTTCHLFFPLFAGDFGVQSVQSFATSVAGTAGSKMGGGLFKPLFWLHGIAETGVEVEREARNEPEIMIPFETTGGVLGSHQMLWINNGTSTAAAQIAFTFHVCEA